MKSFFQLYEQVVRNKKLRLREADGDFKPSEAEPAKAIANQQNQNTQQPQKMDQGPKAVAPAEIPDTDLVADFHDKLDNLVKDKETAAALVKMKEMSGVEDIQTFYGQFMTALGTLEKAVRKMKDADKEEKPSLNNSGAGPSGGNTPPAPGMAPAPPPTTATGTNQ